MGFEEACSAKNVDLSTSRKNVTSGHTKPVSRIDEETQVKERPLCWGFSEFI